MATSLTASEVPKRAAARNCWAAMPMPESVTGAVAARVLQVAMMATFRRADKRQVLPLAPEFVRNSDGRGGKYASRAYASGWSSSATR